MTGTEPLYTAAEMRAAEAGYPGFPESAPELMERAARSVAREVLAAYPDARRVVVVCGAGSNGADGRLAADLLAEAGRECAVVGVDDPWAPLGDCDLVVDALFGTGFQGEPRPRAARLVEAMRRCGVPVVSVDLPSGVDASTGETAGEAVVADLTVTFHGLKVGHAVAPGRFHAGRVVVADIGLEEAETEHRLAGPALLRLVPRRGERDTKYSAGSVVVAGGSPGLSGAVCLAAEGAFRADAGYVTVVAPPEVLAVVEVRVLEAVKRPLSADAVVEAAARAGAVALGPGLGRAPGRRELVAELLGRLALPVVLDADALFGLEPFEREAPTVLTPHAGELARLLGVESAWVGAHRLEAVRRAAERFGCVCLLKGADTLVAAPDAGVLVAAAGPPSLATAGTGDVLTGILAAFLAKGMEPRLAGAAAALAHGLAARAAGHRAGLVAGEVAAALPRVLDEHLPV